MEEVSASQSESTANDTDNPNFKFSEKQDMILSIGWFSGNLGAAYYDVDSAAIHFLLEMVEIPPFIMTSSLIDELKPAVVVTSAKQDTQFLHALQGFCTSKNNFSLLTSNICNMDSSKNIEDDSNSSHCLCCLEMLSSVEFDYQSSRHRILSVDLPDIPKHFTNAERAIYLSSRIPFNDISTIRAAGGLLKYLEKRQFGVMLENQNVGMPIINFCTFTTKNKIRLDKDGYKALQIFHSVRHPSAYKSSTKEGLSLFGILNRTTTMHGYKLLKTWFFRPTCDRNMLKRRLDGVSFFANSKHDEILLSIKNSLKHIKNVAKVIAKIKITKLNVTDWINVLQSSQNALKLADICSSVIAMLDDQSAPSIFRDIVHHFSFELGGVVAMITNYMDISTSKQENRFVVLPGISPVLDNMKQTYNHLPSLLDEVAQQQLETYNNYLSVCQIVYMRRIGYLLFASKDTLSQNVGTSLSIPGLTFVAATDETVFYKTPATQQLDEEYGDILENIAFHEMEIMNQLQNKLLEHSLIFSNVMKFSAELDCLISLAVVAKSYNYVRPSFTNSKDIHIVGGRHPLHEHVVSLFVPNDTHFQEKKELIKIITGPNASGKSVYLKQVGLIIYMAHIGSYVPAESASFGKVTSIFTMMHSPESLSSSLSSFANDLNKISTAICNSDEDSIVLIDEFGKGTATLDGISLLTSCLAHFIEQQNPPKLLCATHFHCVANHDILPKSSIVSFQTMDMIINDSMNSANLFQLIDGISNQSHAGSIAKKIGIPAEIIERGIEITKTIECHAPIYKYDRSSALTYQLCCNEVALHAVNFKLTNTSDLKKLLSNVVHMLDEKNSKNCVRDTTSSDTN